jgi:murein L,D-transpeptidase YafK
VAPFLIFLLIVPFLKAFADESVCTENSQYIEVNTRSSMLYLCDYGRILKEYPVALGRGGLDKTTQGDAKTPRGQYSLGVPRASNRFFMFIPVGYPTAEQKAQGFTGADVGVHGPLRILSWIGPLNAWINWTNGCIAVSSEHEILDIADWVNSNRISTITVH